jgi:hypothetical protein
VDTCPSLATACRGKEKAPGSESESGASRQNLLLVTTLVTSLAKQLAVLLLRHTLAALLDD